MSRGYGIRPASIPSINWSGNGPGEGDLLLQTPRHDGLTPIRQDLPVDFVQQIANAALSEAELIRHYSPMVSRVAHKLAQHRPSFMDRDDLMQDGLVGLLKAIRAIRRGYAEGQFRNFAQRRIRGSIIDSMRTCSPVSREEYRNARRAQKAAAEYIDSVSTVERFRADMTVTSMFLHSAVFDEEIHGGDDRPGPEEHLAAIQTIWRLIDILEEMPKRQREAFIQYAVYDEPQTQIACRLNITVGRVCQIVKLVRQNLRDAIR